METWQQVLGAEKAQPYFQQLLARIRAERERGDVIFPPAPEVFNALKLTEFGKVRVVILGQDPYHNVGQAHGLAFSVREGVQIPPSLVNIYKELGDDIAGFTAPTHGCLNRWAEQGVLLLNTTLTVRAHEANSHAQYGWQTFTDRVIEQVNQHREHVVFLLWGSHAQKKAAMIDRRKHLILTAPHPSPLSAYRGFFGCKHFSQTNAYLREHGQPEIDWQI
ncbi:uracil-DNA glycosylase [Alysiella crassa]|uniref:Uracil-DNA glycosylase n=1 Tax=Alysiella crassa TaxID=153491 RepID=A0A376BUM0_9NEIS|nr:uracil-DNA glycosylase [Alysiella crassa]UOP08249.1 uracil-DNA glycosylase [Alysiella crassa]SSY80712.1 Uracil-DNA glycosylase [Alysiella crassa]